MNGIAIEMNVITQLAGLLPKSISLIIDTYGNQPGEKYIFQSIVEKIYVYLLILALAGFREDCRLVAVSLLNCIELHCIEVCTQFVL